MRLSRKVMVDLAFGMTILTGGWWLWLTTVGQGQETTCRVDKVTFDVDSLDRSGYVNTLESKTSIDYEFCIPYSDLSLWEVHQIDPTIACQNGPSGRIGCTNAQYLCIGSTAEKDARSILCRLSLLDTIERIDQTFWE